MIEGKYSVSEIKEIRRLVVGLDFWEQLGADGCGVTSSMKPEDREAQMETYMKNGTTIEELAAELDALQKSKGGA